MSKLISEYFGILYKSERGLISKTCEITDYQCITNVLLVDTILRDFLENILGIFLGIIGFQDAIPYMLLTSENQVSPNRYFFA